MLCPRTGAYCAQCTSPCSPHQPQGYYTPPNTGWICPRCNVVHAPWVTQCHCHSVGMPLEPPTCGPGAFGGSGSGVA
jgi:hypothetical protein